MAGYESRAYYGADGRVLAQTCVVTDGAVFSALGLRAEDTVQQLGEVTIYPVEYFNPKNFETDELTHLTERTYSIHHHHASWHALGDRMMRNKRRRLLKSTARRRRTSASAAGIAAAGMLSRYSGTAFRG